MKEPDVLRILSYPDPVLSTPCRDVEGAEMLYKKFRLTASKRPFLNLLSIPELVELMIKTCQKKKGAGLAAPQVGMAVRLFVAFPTSDPVVCINPVISDMEGEEEADEGCLSVPGVWSKIKRARKLKLTALDKDGKPFERECEGAEARIYQHEVDHLDGKLILNRIGPGERFRMRNVLERLQDDYDFRNRKK